MKNKILLINILIIVTSGIINSALADTVLTKDQIVKVSYQDVGNWGKPGFTTLHCAFNGDQLPVTLNVVFNGNFLDNVHNSYPVYKAVTMTLSPEANLSNPTQSQNVFNGSVIFSSSDYPPYINFTSTLYPPYFTTNEFQQGISTISISFQNISDNQITFKGCTSSST